MPEVAEPPPAAGPPAAAPAPTHVNLTEPAPVAATPPKPGSARERMQREVAKKMNLEEPPSSTAKPQGDKPADATVKPKQADAPRSGDEPTGEKAEVPPDVTPEQKKQNPWKLYKAEKARAEALERQMAEGKSSSLAETEKAQFLERIEKAEAKLKTYEEELRFKSYEKSDEFKTKYEQPYEQAWSKHMVDLREVPVLSEDGSQHLATAEDMLTLVNASLPEARKLATEKWGDFANDAMVARKEIRALFESKNTALDEARKTGADREKQFQENAAKWRTDVQKHIKDTWDTSNQAALGDPNNGEFFKPVEGDDTRNQLLGKGFSLVDKAFSENPMDPKLTPEQRAEVVKRHAAVRNRAAAFGPMKYLIRQLQAKLKALEKANGEFKESEPPRAGGTSTTGKQTPTSARQRMQAATDKLFR